MRCTTFTVVPFAHDVDEGICRETELVDVSGVDQDNTPTASDSPIAVRQPVDRGVELVVTSDRLEKEPALRNDKGLERVAGEVRLAVRRGELPGVPRWIGQHESRARAHSGVIVLVPWHHARDTVPDQPVIRRQL